MKEKILRYVLKTNESFNELFDRFLPGGQRPLNKTTWQGKEPKSCAVKNIRHSSTKPGIIEIDVSYKPKGCITYVGDTKYDGWTALLVDKRRDGTLLDGHGQPLPDDGRPPVNLPFEVYPEVDFADFEFGDFIGEVDGEGVDHIAHSVVNQIIHSAAKTDIPSREFVVPHRHRPNAKIILSNSPSGTSGDQFHKIINLNNDEPYLESKILNALIQVVSDFLEGKVTIKSVQFDGRCFIELSASLLDCTMNEYGGNTQFDELSSLTPIGFLDDLANRIMAIYDVEATVVDGAAGVSQGGLLFTKPLKDKSAI